MRLYWAYNFRIKDQEKKAIIMFVIKFDGRKEIFDKDKIMKTCMNAGVKKDEATAISEKISNRISNGTSTEDIYRMIIDEINAKQAMLFRLREAISKLDSQSFEIYVKRILENNGYECTWNKILQGKCIEHQIDIIAEKSGKQYLVECKHHRNHHRYLGLGTALQVQARLEDILDKGHACDVWLVTNTKFSEHAKIYSDKKGITTTGWCYKGDLALDKLIHGSKMYPVTLLDASNDTRRKLLASRMITINDIAEEKNAIKIIGEKNFDGLEKQLQELQ